jgi:hypothetical protein
VVLLVEAKAQVAQVVLVEQHQPLVTIPAVVADGSVMGKMVRILHFLVVVLHLVMVVQAACKAEVDTALMVASVVEEAPMMVAVAAAVTPVEAVVVGGEGIPRLEAVVVPTMQEAIRLVLQARTLIMGM